AHSQRRAPTCLLSSRLCQCGHRAPRAAVTAPMSNRFVVLGMIASTSIHPRRHDQNLLEPIRRFECEGHHARIARCDLLCCDWCYKIVGVAMKPGSGHAIDGLLACPSESFQ